MHGNGAIIFKDGSSYKGNFLNGNYNGEGIFTFPDDLIVTIITK